MGTPSSKNSIPGTPRHVAFDEKENASPARKLPPGAPSRRRRASVSAEVDKSKEIVVRKVIYKEQDVIDEIKASVSANFLFNSLPSEHLREVLDAMEEKVYGPGDAIIVEGTDGDDFYIIAEGTCEVFIEGKNEDNSPVRILGKGDAFGELALMYNAPRSATIKAISTPDSFVKCWALDRATFRRTIMSSGQARRKKYEQFLNKLELLKHLTPTEISQLADAVEPLHFSENSVVIHEGDADRASFKFYIVEEGEARAYIRRDGEDVLMSTLGVGDYFGEKALVEMTPRTATVKAHSELKCACLSIAAFERLMGPCAELLTHRATSGYLDVEDVHSGRVTPMTPRSPLVNQTAFF